MDKTKVAIIIASLQNQDTRIRVGLETSLGSLLALMTFLALFGTLGSITIEIAVSSLISGTMLFLNLLYCFSSLGIHKIEIDENFENRCTGIAIEKEDVIRRSRFTYFFGALFMFTAFTLSVYHNWR
jgi:hypothetical protein